MLEGKQRYYYLDFIKIISAFMITFYHTAYYRLDYGFIEGVAYIPNLNRVFMSLCAMSVPLFFMVSGALMLNKKRTIKYMAYKVFKIVLLIAVWYVTGFPVWFFRTLALLYIITPVLKWLFDKHRVWIYLIMAALFIMPFIYNYLIIALKMINHDMIINIVGQSVVVQKLDRTGVFTIYSVLYYLLGALMLNRPSENRIISVILIIAGWAMVIAEVIFETNLCNKMFDGVNASFPTIGALCMAVGAFSLMKTLRYCEKTVKFITFISPYVLSIYVMHLIIIKGLTNLMHIESMTFIGALCFAVLVDAIAVCIGWIINKVPYLREVIKI